MSSKIDPNMLKVVLATDCGSTTTKALLFEKGANGWRVAARGEAPTTVEKPVADVTVGAINAFSELEEASGRKLLATQISEESSPLIPRGSTTTPQGVDLYVSTSSAGGGLQMVVAGAVRSMSAESAERAALGAGAIVLDTLSLDDGREQFERVSQIRYLKPDIVLLAGGTEGGNNTIPLELAETVLQADPQPRFGETLKLPVIYAGNSQISPEVSALLKDHFSVEIVENLRPTLERENPKAARDAVHELFLEHVMSHAPGYKKLLQWSPVPIIPTPSGMGEMVKVAADRLKLNILAIDIGGATTDVFTVIRQDNESPLEYQRSVSANLGMSYSIGNVLLEAGAENILRWLPFLLAPGELRDRLRNKMVRPTSIPQTREDLLVEQAVAREALRLSLAHHLRLAVSPQGLKVSRTLASLFSERRTSAFNISEIDLVIGSGGVLSHAPNRNEAALMLLDAFEPEGITLLAVDSAFMMPHLGVFSTVHPEAATEIFLHDCLVELGTVIAPMSGGLSRGSLLKVEIEGEAPQTLNAGELKLLPCPAGTKISARITPLSGRVDIGAGRGIAREVELAGGTVGLILDGRGRPVGFPKSNQNRTSEVWHRSFGVQLE